MPSILSHVHAGNHPLAKRSLVPAILAVAVTLAAPVPAQAQTGMLRDVLSGILVTQLCESKCWRDFQDGLDYCRQADAQGILVYEECALKESLKYIDCRDSCPPLLAPDSLDLPFGFGE